MKTKLSGFTLIELVLVIVVVGILAVTALPRLVNLQSDSRIAALNGLQAGMQSAVDLVYPVALKSGLAAQSIGQITIEGDPVDLVYGYPAALAKQTWGRLMHTTFADGNFNPETPAEWYFENPQNAADKHRIYFMTKSLKEKKHQCYLRYNEATATAPPFFEIETKGC